MKNELIEYVLPETKADITLAQWQKYIPFDSDDVDPKIRITKMIEIFCGVPSRKISLLKAKDVEEMIHYLTKVFSERGEVVKTFVFEGVEYGLIPDFDDEIAQGELDDLNMYYEDKQWARFLSILYRPITKHDRVTGLYQIETYSSTHTLFENARYDILEKAVVFFWNTVTELLKCSLNFSHKKIVQEMKKKNIQMETYLPQLNLLKDGADLWNSFTL